jgi:polyphosphate kinase
VSVLESNQKHVTGWQPRFPSVSRKSNYINRDLSWIEFNRRVLQEAQDLSTPLLERVKFLSIVSSNLDEFMSVRIAGMKEQNKAFITKSDFSGYTPQKLLRRTMKRAAMMVAEQYRTYRELTRLLAKEHIIVSCYDDLNTQQKQAMDDYFVNMVFPVLTPMAVDQSRPFPLVHSQSIYLSVLLHKGGVEQEAEPFFAIVQIPSNLPRIIKVPVRPHSKKHEYILLEDLIEQHIASLFSGYTTVAVNSFRLTRNADLVVNEEEAEDLLEEIEKELHKRRRGAPVRLEVQKGMHPTALEWLVEEFELTEDIFMIDGPLDLTFLMKFVNSLQGFEHLRYPRVDSVYPREFADTEDMFSVIRERDVLMYHPYESFEAVNDFIAEAAQDPSVLAIKMMMYRVSGNSEIVKALALAAEAGKQVTVVVELKARFDEERNIAWARKLEKAGCHVVYGLVGLKTHAKIMLVVRQEEEELRRYVHVGTGNYNDATARLYTDIGLFTAHPIIGEDASMLFNEVTGYSAPRSWKALVVAPTDLKPKLFELIRREAEHAAAGRAAGIIAKMNSLSNQETIDELYGASVAGVQIELIVRGVCCLRPGIPGVSDNIKVRSIVDRFLEHSRIFYFENGGEPEVWLSSADWMTRNLTRRIELMCPVFDERLKAIVIQILKMSLHDNVKARELQANGQYRFVHNGLTPFRSQFEAQDIVIWKSQPSRYED